MTLYLKKPVDDKRILISTAIEQSVHASACVCRDIEHAGSLESTKKA